MKVSIKKWGNSFGMRIPKEILKELNWRREDFNLEIENGKIVAELVEPGYEKKQFNIIIGESSDGICTWDAELDGHVVIYNSPEYTDVLQAKLEENYVLYNKDCTYSYQKFKSSKALEVSEMIKERYNLFENIGVKNIIEYNSIVEKKLPRVFLEWKWDGKIKPDELDEIHKIILTGKGAGFNVVTIVSGKHTVDQVVRNNSNTKIIKEPVTASIIFIKYGEKYILLD